MDSAAKYVCWVVVALIVLANGIQIHIGLPERKVAEDVWYWDTEMLEDGEIKYVDSPNQAQLFLSYNFLARNCTAFFWKQPYYFDKGANDSTLPTGSVFFDILINAFCWIICLALRAIIACIMIPAFLVYLWGATEIKWIFWVNILLYAFHCAIGLACIPAFIMPFFGGVVSELPDCSSSDSYGSSSEPELFGSGHDSIHNEKYDSNHFDHL